MARSSLPSLPSAKPEKYLAVIETFPDIFKIAVDRVLALLNDPMVSEKAKNRISYKIFMKIVPAMQLPKVQEQQADAVAEINDELKKKAEQILFSAVFSKKDAEIEALKSQNKYLQKEMDSIKSKDKTDENISSSHSPQEK